MQYTGDDLATAAGRSEVILPWKLWYSSSDSGWLLSCMLSMPHLKWLGFVSLFNYSSSESSITYSTHPSLTHSSFVILSIQNLSSSGTYCAGTVRCPNIAGSLSRKWETSSIPILLRIPSHSFPFLAWLSYSVATINAYTVPSYMRP